MTDKKNKIDLNTQWLTSCGNPKLKVPECDVAKYHEHVKDFDLTEEEQGELLKSLWSIMAAFVDLGFGVDSVQLLRPPEKAKESRGMLDLEKHDGLDSSKRITHDDN